MDVLEVKKAGERAVEHAISGKGPYILNDNISIPRPLDVRSSKISHQR